LREGIGSAQPLVSLLTDFGSVDPFVAEMKAVILSICREARIVDITHGVAKFDIRMGAFLLAEVARTFPAGTVHVAVVDPGVGSSRRGLVVKTKRSVYVGPDNGLLIPAASMDGIVGVFGISDPPVTGREISSTFHGRDIFAPVAAHIACGHHPEEYGPSVREYVPSPFHEPTVDEKRTSCEILHIDKFGNLTTNLTQTHVKQWRTRIGQQIALTIGKRRIRARIVRTYSDLNRNELGLMLGSHGFMELACRESNAARRLRIRRGRVVRLSGY